MESRTNSALFKRAEQLRRWEESETNREPASARSNSRRIQFSDGCVFLSACAAGDKEEVLKLIRQGADIDTPNVDGLTALHQVSRSFELLSQHTHLNHILHHVSSCRLALMIIWIWLSFWWSMELTSIVEITKAGLLCTPQHPVGFYQLPGM